MTQIERLEALILEPATALAYAHDIVLLSAGGDVEPLEMAVEAMLRFGDNYPAGFWVLVIREIERLAPAWRY
jgi:hypothetical protein